MYEKNIVTFEIDGEKLYVRSSSAEIGRVEEKMSIEKDNNGHYKQLCKCCCGNQKLVRTNDLLNNRIISCGCRSPIKVAKSKSKIKAGQKFGRWTVLEYSSKHRRWKCICECGNECCRQC